MQGSPPSAATSFLRKRDSWIRSVIDDDRLSHTAARIGVHIAMRMNGSKQSGAWPSISTMANQCGMSRRTVSDAVNELCGYDRKAKEWTDRRYLTAERKRNRGNRYWLNWWWE
jgi:AraC-like DNA-binding protein